MTYVPHIDRHGSIQAAVATLQAGEILDHLNSIDEEALSLLARQLDDGAKCVRAVLRERIRARHRAEAAARREQQAAAILAEYPETDDPERNGTIPATVGAAPTGA